MKKKFRLTIASLALCTVSCLALAVATSIKPNKTQTVTAETNVAPISNTYTLADFKIDETAAIRRADPMGIRFPTTVSADVKTQIINKLGGDESKVQFGTLIIPTDFLGEEELTHNTPSVVVGTVSAWTTDTVFTVVLGGKDGADLGESYYNRPLSARSFARNTETGEVCYTVNTANRSIGYVAYKANADGDESTVVAEIADKTKKELVFNESVSIYNEEIAGTGLIVNKYDKQSTNVFTLKIGGIAVDVISEGATITYSTSNSGIISTENGEVKAVDKGVATVTANITYDGVNYTSSKTISTDTYVSSSEFKILVPANADTYETTAANKLQDILLEATGVELAIITESGNETTDGKYLSVGDTALAKANCAVNDLTKNTASRVKTVGESVFVRGVTKAATLYGVQQLLSDTVGYEYYVNNAYVVNEEKEVVIEDKDYVPQIDEVWQMGGAEALAEEHAAVAYTANVIPIGTTDEEDQTSSLYKGVAHNSILFFSDGVNDNSLYTSSSKSYKKWYATNSSNYYLTSKSGVASLLSGAGKVELCYTAHGDSTVRNAMIEKLAAEMFRKMTTIEEFKSYNRVAFSHSDMQTWCQCSKCKDEGNPSDNMLHFILDVAANLKTKLANAGDARAETFKICTLFYNETNLYPKNIANYQSAVDNYMQHMEIWFAETRADYHVSLKTETTWNTTAKSNFDQWTALANSKGADVLWWGYYASAKTSFIPYDSIDALRANYALAYENGVDYMFNQMMQYAVNWSRLKQYLSSELRWNATPDDATWNGWIADYMKAAFGPGADAMTEYYNAWKSWAADNKDNFNNDTGYSGSGIYKQLSNVCTTSNMSAATLQGWIASCDKAIAALDVNDDNYTLYYNNIVLEKMTPLYLIMHLYGYNYELEGNYDTKASYSVKNSAYILPYAQDFLDAAAIWNVYQDGELTNLDNFKAALESQIAGITEYKESSKQTVVVGTSITLSSANIAAGETYDVTLINSAGAVTGTSSATSDGSVTITFASAPAVGPCNVELRSASKVITFNNVVLVTGTIGNYAELKAITGKTNSGYYVLTNDITDATGTITLRAGSFKGVLDGNGYTVSNISVGASGLFKALNGAIIKNINFVNYTATGAAFGTTATNCTFENMSISFVSGGPAFATTETGCAYKNVTIYVASASAVSVPDGAKLVVGAETGKTFYIPEGENEVWIRDEKLVQGNYTIEVNGEISTGSVFAEGRLKVAIPGVALGETIKVSCDNGTSAYVYNVMRVAKITDANGNLLSEYNGDKTALGYYNSDVVQYKTFENGSGGWNDGIVSNRFFVWGNTKQDYITFDFVVDSAVSGALFQMWPQKGTGTVNSNGVFTDSSDDPSGAIVSIVDEYGFAVNSIAAGKKYTLRAYDPGADNLEVGVWGTHTIYFGNVTYGKGMPKTLDAPSVWVGDNRVYSIYQGDETALGFDADTMVFLLENNTPDNIYGDGWGKRMIFGAPTTQDYITFEFVAKEDVEAADIFHVWGANGAPSIGTISTATGKGGDWAIIFDKHGLGVTSIKAGEHYFANIKCAGLTNVQVGALDANEIYVANVTFHNGELPTAIQPLVYGVDNSAVSVYEGDKEAIGLADQELVFASTAGANTWNDNAIKFYTDSSKNCLEIDFALSNTLNSGNQFMIWTSAVSGGAAAFINNGNVTQNVIDVEILDADGNAVTEFAANTKYTFKIYHVGSTTVTIALVGETQKGTTVYYGDYSDTDDKFIALPENVVTYSTDGGHTNEPLSKYTGDATAYGFGAEDYVFEANMTAAWDDRAIIAVDSANYDYMDVEFVVTSGAWYFNAWVVNAGGMLDGSYLVAENASNATYGSGYAPHTPNTGASGGKTKMQVLDTNGNVVTGGREVGTRYILRVYLDEESLTKVHLGQDNVTMLFANVTFGIVETITADSTNASAVTVYDGDETALGFAEGSRVYEYVGADSSKDKAVFSVDSANYDYVDVQLVIASGDGYFFAYALNGGNYLNGGASYVIDPSNIRLASGNAMDRTIQVFDANGNAVSTLMSTNTLYTLRIYINGADQIKIAKTGSTIYLANVTFGNDVEIEKPEEVVVNGDAKTELPQYAGNNADIGFAETDWVFEHATTSSSWGGRVHIGNNSAATFLVFDFASSNPSNLTVWFTRNGNVIGGYSNIVTPTGYIAANESAARKIYVFDENNAAVTQMVETTKYTMWVYLDGADDFDGIAIGNGDDITLYYANVRYVYGTDEILRQGDANALLPVYDSDVDTIGFAPGTFVQKLTGTSDIWIEDIYANRARITASGTQDYIAVDFVLENALSGGNLFKMWLQKGTGTVNSNGVFTDDGDSGAIVSIVDEYGFAVTSLVAGKKYTLYVYDPGATYLAIGAYCNNTIYFGNVTYGNGELEEPYALLGGSSGTLATYEGDVTSLGFDEGEYVQQMITEATDNVWDGTRQSLATDILAPVGQYVSIMFSLDVDFTSSEENLFFAWCRNGEDWPTNFYVTLTPSANARILGTNGEVVTDTLKANTVYMLELYADGVDRYQVANINQKAITVSFATKSIKTYSTSIANSPITGSADNTVTVAYTAEKLGFGRNEVVKQLETETVSNVWGDTQPTSGKSRPAWLIKVASEAGKVVKVRFSVSVDVATPTTLFYVWAWNGSSALGNGYANNTATTEIAIKRVLDVNGNTVSSIKANTVYELELYAENATKYEIGNFVAEGMITYVSSEVTYTDYTA